MNDETINEIRTIRHLISDDFSHDPQNYIDYLKSQSHKYMDQIERYKTLSEHTEHKDELLTG